MSNAIQAVPHAALNPQSTLLYPIADAGVGLFVRGGVYDGSLVPALSEMHSEAGIIGGAIRVPDARFPQDLSAEVAGGAVVRQWSTVTAGAGQQQSKPRCVFRREPAGNRVRIAADVLEPGLHRSQVGSIVTECDEHPLKLVGFWYVADVVHGDELTPRVQQAGCTKLEDSWLPGGRRDDYTEAVRKAHAARCPQCFVVVLVQHEQ